MPRSDVRGWMVAVWTACAALCAGGATHYVIDLSGGPNAASYPMEIREGEPADGWTDEHKTTKLALRRIEPGTFMMCGQVQTTLTRPFFIGVFEVTSAQYAQVMGGSGTRLPKAGISYNAIRGDSSASAYAWPSSANVDPSTFIGKLRAKTGLATLDLPTEAQWEYACRAGTTTDFNDGTDLANPGLDDLGRYEGNGDDGRGGEENFYTETTVGSYQPNDWGLYDMHGNVQEWCLDYNGPLAGGDDPVGDATGNNRVMRGGGFTSSAAIYCGASYRTSDAPASTAEQNGFRVVCMPAEIMQSATPYEGVYDGEGHGIAVDVAMPPAATVRYALSEGGPYQAEPILFTNATAGAVTVWYKVEATGYDTVTGNSTVTIGKATYDMSGVAWDYAGPFEGDGAEKSVVLLGLPDGVTATYTGNTATDPGTYTAHAILSYDATNYEAPAMADLEWTINRPTTFGDFVNCPDLDFVTGGNADWYPVENESPDGFALRSGNITHSQTSRLEVVVSGPGTISFWCRVEGEEFRGRVYDGLAFCVDGERQGDGLLSTNDWTQLTFEVTGDGSHTLSWLYIKDDEGDGGGADCAWLDAVAWTPTAAPELRFTYVSAGNGVVTVAVSAQDGEISSAQVMGMLEATSNLSDWEGGALPITVTDLTDGVARTVWLRVTLQDAVPRVFLRIRE